MTAGNENRPPPWSPPPNYVTLDMLRERYLKAQEQKRIDSDKEERERGGGDPEKNAAEEVNHAVETNRRNQKEAEERENRKRREKEAMEEVPKTLSGNNSVAAASSHPPVKTNRWNQLNSRKGRDNQKRREKEEMSSKINVSAPSRRVQTSSRRGLEMEDGENGNKSEEEIRLPPWSPPPNYVTLDMLRERYLKAQEQKRIDSEKEERERSGHPEETAEEVPKTLTENSSAVASSHRPVKTNLSNQRKSRKKRGNQTRREKEEEDITEMPSEIVVATPHHVETSRGKELETVEDRGSAKKSEKEESGEYGRKIKGRKKYGKKKKAKADETLGRSVEKVQGETVEVNGVVWVKKNVPVVINPMAEIEEKFGDLSVRNGKPVFTGGGRRPNRNAQGEPTVETGQNIGKVLMIAGKGGKARDAGKKAKSDTRVENGQGISDLLMSDEKKGEVRDVKMKVEGDPMAENGLKIGDLLRSNRKGGGARHVSKNKVAQNWQKITDISKDDSELEIAMDIRKNVEDDPVAEKGRTNGAKRGGNGRRNVRGGSVKRYGGMGRANRGETQMDSSLVWVRKEEKADVCVAGNCLEGVLEKAGEKEKKPDRGRA